MPIQITCPDCAKSAAVPETAAGKTVKCGCGTTFFVQSTPVSPSPALAHPNPGTLQKATVHCLECQNTLAGFFIPDGRFICPNCAPPAVYQRWVKDWAPIQKQLDKENAKRKQIERELALKETDEKRRIAAISIGASKPDAKPKKSRIDLTTIFACLLIIGMLYGIGRDYGIPVLGAGLIVFAVYAFNSRCPRCKSFFTKHVLNENQLGNRLNTRSVVQTDTYKDREGNTVGTREREGTKLVTENLVQTTYFCSHCQLQWKGQEWRESN